MTVAPRRLASTRSIRRREAASTPSGPALERAENEKIQIASQKCNTPRQCTRIRTALISDIHGNAIALEAVLADLERDPVDQVICLGDTVQGGCQPAEVVALLRRLGCPTVLGNADAFVVDESVGAEEPTERQLDVREWTRARLGGQGL